MAEDKRGGVRGAEIVARAIAAGGCTFTCGRRNDGLPFLTIKTEGGDTVAVYVSDLTDAVGGVNDD